MTESNGKSNRNLVLVVLLALAVVGTVVYLNRARILGTPSTATSLAVKSTDAAYDSICPEIQKTLDSMYNAHVSSCEIQKSRSGRIDIQIDNNLGAQKDSAHKLLVVGSVSVVGYFINNDKGISGRAVDSLYLRDESMPKGQYLGVPGLVAARIQNNLKVGRIKMDEAFKEIQDKSSTINRP
jgi:hypothetical protein